MELLAVAFLIFSLVHYQESVGASSAGKPLLLTSYITKDKLKEGKKAATVNLKKFGIRNLKSYSGFFTVDENYDSNLFFWFIEAQKNADKAPIVIWLQGGPGNSSLFGLFEENGPVYIDNKNKMKKRDITWNTYHSMLYIDSPVGAGFSYTSKGGYCQNQTIIAQHLYNAITQFFQLFKELKGREVYITGESYAGKYVPVLGHTIMKNNPTACIKINLKGMAIGNGFSDPANMLWKSEYLYKIGLLDSVGKEAMAVYENQVAAYIEKEQWYLALETFYYMFFSTRDSLFVNLTGYHYYYNFLLSEKPANYYRPYVINNNNFRKAIHAGSGTFENYLAQQNLIEDAMKSVTEYINDLLPNYPIMFYNGELDLLITSCNADKFLGKLDYSITYGYSTTLRQKWYVNKELAGYVRNVGNLTQVVVRNAGHMAPKDQPSNVLDLITRFISNTPYDTS